MEIHAHHHEAPGKEIKPWKHYAMEFFMLFLAVSAGFISDNIREHIVENNRAREMAIGLYDDLEKDSVQIDKVLKRKSLFIEQMTLLMKTLSDKDIKDKASLLTYYQASFLMEMDMPIPSKTNLEQLINSGSLRYFKNKKLVTEISQWDNAIEARFKVRHETDQKRLIEEIKAVSRVFYPVIIDSMRTLSFTDLYENKPESAETLERLENTPAKLISYNEPDVNEVIGWASERKRNAIARSTSFLPEQLESVRKLMHDLNEEFDLKKE